jgi:hypothetical protein
MHGGDGGIPIGLVSDEMRPKVSGRESWWNDDTARGG